MDIKKSENHYYNKKEKNNRHIPYSNKLGSNKGDPYMYKINFFGCIHD